MGDRVDLPPDDGLPRSASGRQPRWVREGAEVVPLRRRRGPRRPAWASIAGWSVAVGALVVFGLGVLQTWTPFSVPGSAGPPDAARPPAGVEEGARPRGALDEPLPEPSDGSFRYIVTGSDGSLPVTWSPCRPIHYVVRTDNATADGPGLLRSALDEISRDTGLRFVDDGTTTESPGGTRELYQPERYGDRWAPVLISWVTQQEDADMTAGVLGLTRPAAVSAYDGARVLVSGEVEMNADLIARVQRELGVKATRTVFLHELGHLVGLDHVESRRSVMYPEYQESLVTFAPAELQGLRSLGSGACRSDV